MKRTVLLSLGFAAALVANAGIKDAVMMELPQSANRQAVEFKEKKVVAAPTVYNQKVVSAGKLVKSFKNMGIYQTKDGKYVRVINKNNKLDLNNYSKSKAVEAAADASFSENFDGWDGETANWLPTGWSQESKVGSDANLMWGVAEGNFYAMAYEGYSLNITAAMDLDPETFAYIFPEQDEWCYSPAFTVAAGDYLSFMLNYDPGLTLLNWDVMQSTSEYVFDKERGRVKADAKVYGEVWYVLKINYPFAYYEEKETGRKKENYVLKVLNKDIDLSTKSYKNKKYEEENIISHPLLPIKLVYQKQKEVKVINEVLTFDEALSKAQEKLTNKIKDKLKENEYIINSKYLKSNIKDGSIEVEMFFSVCEDITDYQVITNE